MRASFQVPRSRWLSVTLALANLILAVGILRWAREVLIPIALAILLAFILSPIVSVLRRLGLGRTLSVALTVALTFALLGGIGTMITIELRSLANELPNYRENIRKKISDVRLAGKSAHLERAQRTLKELVEEFKKEAPGSTNTARAVPVVVTGGQVAATPGAALFGPLMERAASAGLALVLVVFMLLRREDLRDRLLRLAGDGRLAATTKAIDEAGKRLSKYLLRQSGVNAGFGIGVGTGLALIGLPYAILWGFLAAVARFIPYVGPWLGASAPILMSLAVFDSWTAPLLVIGLVVGLELITGLLLEPVLYGQSIGVSEVALLVMIAFWTWLWGPIGMVLATPLTVCLMVVSKSVDGLEFIGLLLSSEPALDSHHVFYQRLVAKDHDGARQIAEAYLKDHSRVELFEHVLIPTLVSIRRDRLAGEDKRFAFHCLRECLGEGGKLTGLEHGEGRGRVVSRGWDGSPGGVARPLILGYPANDEGDELALAMLAELLDPGHWEMHVLSSRMLASESLAEVERRHPVLVCIGLLPRGAFFPLRLFCKGLRSRFPGLPVVVARWGAKDRERTEEQLDGVVDAIGWRIAETRNQVIQFAQASPAASGPLDPNPLRAGRESREQESGEGPGAPQGAAGVKRR